MKAFINSIETGKLINDAQSGATSTLSAILGRMSAESHKETGGEEMMNSDQKYFLNLNLKQFDK